MLGPMPPRKLWCQEKETDGEDQPILRMNPLYEQVRCVIQELREESNEYLGGKNSAWPWSRVRETNAGLLLTDILVQDKEDVHNLMTALVDGVVLVMGRQLSSQLPGGEFGALVQRWRKQRSPVLQTNSSGERTLPWLMRSFTRPSTLISLKLKGKSCLKQIRPVSG